MISYFTGLAGGLINYASQLATNKANLRQVEMQNKAAKEEAELAYNRSLPTNQVGNMMAAGMSRAGAINALNNGGSYTPAPVNAGQSQAPQLDTATMVNAAHGMLQLKEQKRQYNEQHKHDEKMQDKQLAATKEQQKAQLKSNERIAQLQADSSRYSTDITASTAADRLEFDKNKWNDEVKVLRAQIRNLDSNTSLTNEQKKQLVELKPYLKENAIEEINKIKEEVKSIKSIRDLEAKRFALERVKVRVESYYGVSINHMRNTLQYWEDRPETLYKGFKWRTGELNKLAATETDLENYLEELNNLLDALD